MKKNIKIIGGSSRYTEEVVSEQYEAELKRKEKERLKENLEKLKWWNGEED